MDNWRQERLDEVNTALELTVQRIEKLVRRINLANFSQKGPHRNNSNQVCSWTDEVARLQDMEDQLLDFRRRLFFYSNLEYIEARRYWDHAIAKQVVKAKSFGAASSSQNNSGRGFGHSMNVR